MEGRDDLPIGHRLRHEPQDGLRPRRLRAEILIRQGARRLKAKRIGSIACNHGRDIKFDPAIRQRRCCRNQRPGRRPVRPNHRVRVPGRIRNRIECDVAYDIPAVDPQLGRVDPPRHVRHRKLEIDILFRRAARLDPQLGARRKIGGGGGLVHIGVLRHHHIIVASVARAGAVPAAHPANPSTAANLILPNNMFFISDPSRAPCCS